MSNEKLIKFVKKQKSDFKKIMKATEHDGTEYDYAYAEGAYNAYEIILKKLRKAETVSTTNYTLHKEKLWVADDGSWGQCDILIADIGKWTGEQVSAFDDIANNSDPSITEVINILTDTKEVN
jgi:hypothetical protein